jgi:hypothetical protein
LTSRNRGYWLCFECPRSTTVDQVTAQDGGSTGRDDRPTFWCGASLFNAGGQRLNEIDLGTYQHLKTLAEMSDADWEQAAAAVRAFEAERGLR